MTRHIQLDAVENFRDYGDYPTASGRRMKRGRFFRSASHALATDADLAIIGGLNLAAIVDLRRPGERSRAPSRRAPGFTGQVIENQQEESEDDDPWWTFVKNSDLSGAAFDGYLMDYYREAPFKERHVDLYTRYFRLLDEIDGPILVHCSAGKDRTGVIVALTHFIAGVGRDDMVADYLLTNNPERMAARMPMVKASMAEATGRTPSDDAVRAAIGVKAEFLDEAFRAIKAAHGSVEAYLEAVLGVDGAMRERVREKLLA